MKSRFNKFITTNPWLKLASFILAVLLWFFVASKGRSVIVMDVPIELKNIPAQMEVLEHPKTVSVTLKGRERLLERLKEKDISVIIDISKVKEGETSFSLSSDNIALPRELAVAEFSPSSVRLLVEKRVKKDVPVRPIIVGSPVKGFLIDKIEVEPELITIKGPKSVITKLYAVKTEPIYITGIASSLQYSAQVDIPKGNIRMDTHKVRVNVLVRKEE